MHDDVELDAFSDNASLSSQNLFHLVATAQALDAEAAQIGLTMQWDECKVLVPASVDIPLEINEFSVTKGVTVIRDTTIHLGAPLGWSDIDAKHLIAAKLDDMRPMFKRLQHPALTAQETMLLLRVCIVPKMVYLQRTRPDWLKTVAEEFDQLVLDAATSKLQLPALLTANSSNCGSNSGTAAWACPPSSPRLHCWLHVIGCTAQP